MYEVKAMGALLIAGALIMIYVCIADKLHRARQAASRKKRYRRYKKSFMRDLRINKIEDKPIEAEKRKGYTAFYSEELAEHFGGVSMREVHKNE